MRSNLGRLLRQSTPITSSRWLRLSSRFYVALLLLLTYLPVIIVVAYSFNEGRYGVWRGFTTQWYTRLLTNRSIRANLMNSLKVAFASCGIAIVIGTAGAVGMTRSHFWGKDLLENLAIAPLMLPEIILGMAYLTLFTAMKVTFGMGTLIIAHSTFCIPYIYLNVQSRLAGMDPNLVEAARDLGASPGRAFRDITLPLITPSIFSGAILAFAMSMDDVVISFFVKGVTSDTLPIRIYSLSKVGITPEVYALCALMLVVIIMAIALFYTIRKITQRRTFHA
ncbi:MAG: ABC transporter permease [Symbiobacteriaceae bacterium]|nr:ABC transporter permease [Symbiobacteriaceae bacterium]